MSRKLPSRQGAQDLVKAYLEELDAHKKNADQMREGMVEQVVTAHPNADQSQWPALLQQDSRDVHHIEDLKQHWNQISERQDLELESIAEDLRQFEKDARLLQEQINSSQGIKAADEMTQKQLDMLKSLFATRPKLAKLLYTDKDLAVRLVRETKEDAAKLDMNIADLRGELSLARQQIEDIGQNSKEQMTTSLQPLLEREARAYEQQKSALDSIEQDRTQSSEMRKIAESLLEAAQARKDSDEALRRELEMRSTEASLIKAAAEERQAEAARKGAEASQIHRQVDAKMDSLAEFRDQLRAAALEHKQRMRDDEKRLGIERGRLDERLAHVTSREQEVAGAMDRIKEARTKTEALDLKQRQFATFFEDAQSQLQAERVRLVEKDQHVSDRLEKAAEAKAEVSREFGELKVEKDRLRELLGKYWQDLKEKEEFLEIREQELKATQDSTQNVRLDAKLHLQRAEAVQKGIDQLMPDMKAQAGLLRGVESSIQKAATELAKRARNAEDFMKAVRTATSSTTQSVDAMKTSFHEYRVSIAEELQDITKERERIERNIHNVFAADTEKLVNAASEASEALNTSQPLNDLTSLLDNISIAKGEFANSQDVVKDICENILETSQEYAKLMKSAKVDLQQLAKSATEASTISSKLTKRSGDILRSSASKRQKSQDRMISGPEDDSRSLTPTIQQPVRTESSPTVAQSQSVPGADPSSSARQPNLRANAPSSAAPASSQLTLRGQEGGAPQSNEGTTSGRPSAVGTAIPDPPSLVSASSAIQELWAQIAFPNNWNMVASEQLLAEFQKTVEKKGGEETSFAALDFGCKQQVPFCICEKLYKRAFKFDQGKQDQSCANCTNSDRPCVDVFAVEGMPGKTWRLKKRVRRTAGQFTSV